jgi:hypothetical protein
MSGFVCDFAEPESRITMVLRADPWALASMDELRRLAQQHGLADVPASCLRRELKALEHSRGQPEGSMLVALRGSKR